MSDIQVETIMHVIGLVMMLTGLIIFIVIVALRHIIRLLEESHSVDPSAPTESKESNK